MAPVSLKPSSTAPLFESSTKRVKSLRMGGEMVRQPFQTSSSSAGLVLVAMILVMSLMSRQVFAIVLAVLALAVSGVERGRDLAHFGAFLGVGRRREGEADFQQLQHAGGIGGHVDAVELLRVLGQADGFIAGALAGGGGKRLGVVGDEVFLDPFGAAGLDAEVVELDLGVVEKFLGVVGGGLGLAAAG